MADPHEIHTPKPSYTKDDLIASSRGGYFGPGNAQLPAPPMLMMDRITALSLDGGVGGFFQRRCVEVVARRAMPRVNAYDDGPPSLLVPPPESDPEPTSPAIREIMRVASPFVDQLQAAQAGAAPAAVTIASATSAACSTSGGTKSTRSASTPSSASTASRTLR